MVVTTGSAGAWVAHRPGRAVAGARRLVVIDGPSGAGKSTLADRIVAVWPRPVTLVRLDEVYPGWRGLDRGAELIAARLIAPWSAVRVGRVHGWDWHAGRPGPVRWVPPKRDLVVEGCGAFAAARGASAVRVWVDAPAVARKRAALARDQGAFDAFWDLWDAQWRWHAARTGASAAHADLRVRGLSS